MPDEIPNTPDAEPAGVSDKPAVTGSVTPAPLVQPQAKHLPPTAKDVVNALSSLHPDTLKAALAMLSPTAAATQAVTDQAAPVATNPRPLTVAELQIAEYEATTKHVAPDQKAGFCE